MLVIFRRMCQRVVGRSFLMSRSIWVDVGLLFAFCSLFLMVYQEQKERAIRKGYQQRHGAIEIMAADGKLVKVAQDEVDMFGEDSLKAVIRANAPDGEVANAKGREYRNISEMAGLVKNKNIARNIQKILTDIPQSFGSACDNVFYPDSQQFPASLIIVFCDYQLYDLKVTLSSIQVNTADSLIEEIIVVDDGSSDQRVIEEAQVYVKKIPKAKLLRTENRLGESAWRISAAKIAKARNIVFLSTTVVVAPGWLEPINDYLFRHHKAIVVPHLDKVFDTYKYETVRKTWIAPFRWSLQLQMQKNTLPEDQNIMNGVSTPLFKSDVFAISQDFLDNYGLYDESLIGTGAENIELALRTWMCSGSVRVIRCSHVGVLDMAEVNSIDDAFGAWRVAQMWLSNYVSLIATESSLHHNPTAKDITDVLERKLALNTTGKCDKTPDWYITNIAKSVSVPSISARSVGFLKLQNGFCAHVFDETRLELDVCRPTERYSEIDMTFELTGTGQIKVNGKCVSNVDSYAQVIACEETNNDHQLWQYRPDHTFHSKLDGGCLMHVTDPKLKLEGEIFQTLMVQRCNKDQTPEKNFSAFYFAMAGE